MIRLGPLLGTAGLLVAGVLLVALGLYAQRSRPLAWFSGDRLALHGLADLVLGLVITIGAFIHIATLLSE